VNPSRRTLVILALAGIAVAGLISFTYIADFSRNNTATLPSGCVRPIGGFLVVASRTGFNDSASHGAPAKVWPIITVHQGQNVTIIVCNVDTTAHGFQITRYFDSTIETLAPGQILTISFVADKLGSYTIRCDIFCPIHFLMQNGLLKVEP
jgi:heme/copper-type cytochrome/quinol oxidase subunit 2